MYHSGSMLLFYHKIAPAFNFETKKGAFFAAAKNRAFRGSAIAPAPALCAVAASRPSNPLRVPYGGLFYFNAPPSR
jgi:hypothetical protein